MCTVAWTSRGPLSHPGFVRRRYDLHLRLIVKGHRLL